MTVTTGPAADGPEGPKPGAKRRRPDAGLADELPTLGERAVGSPAEDVRRQRTRQGMARVWVSIVAVLALAAVATVWVLSHRRDKAAAAPIAKSAEAEGMAMDAVDAPKLERPAADSMPIITLGNSGGPPPILHAGNTDSALAALGGTGSGGLIGPPPAAPGALPPVTAPAQGAQATTIPRLDPPDPATSSGGAAAAGAPNPYGESPAFPAAGAVDSMRLTPSFAARLRRADGTIKVIQGTTEAGTGPLTSALAQGADEPAPTQAADAAALTPGTRVRATIDVAVPSGTSGEPLIAVLDEPLVVRGRQLLPPGTRAVGTGTIFDDGTGNPRLLIKFATYVFPDGRNVRRIPGGVAFDPDDNRLGLQVPLNRQLGRKGKRVAAAAALAGAAAALLPKTPDAGSVFSQPSPAAKAQGQAYESALTTAQNEMGLNAPASGVLLKLDRGKKLYIVWGLVEAGTGEASPDDELGDVADESPTTGAQ